MFASRSKVTSCMLFETGTYNDLAVRPYQSHIDGHTFNNLAEITHHGTNLSTGTLSAISGDLLRPTAAAAGISSVINGWDTARFKFIMVVEEPQIGASITRHYFTGYTSHLGIANGGALDPNMKLYFNSCMTIVSMQENTPMGIQWRNTIHNTFEYIPKAFGFTGANQERLIRPADVFNTMAIGAHMAASLGMNPMTPDGSWNPNGQLPQHGANFAQQGLNNVSSNQAASLITGSRVSGQANNISAHYLSNIIKANDTACDNSDDEQDDVQEVIQRAAGEASRLSGDRVLSQTPIYHEISQVSDFKEDCGIQVNQLQSIFPELSDPSVLQASRCNVSQRALLATRGSRELWTAQTNEAVAASIIASAVPALMTSCMITHIQLTASNLTIDGSVSVEVSKAHSIVSNIPVETFANMFRNKVVSELMPDVTINNRQHCNVTISADLTGDLIIGISVNQGPLTEFVTPTFCSGLSNRVVSSVAQDTNVFTSNIQQVVDGVREMTLHTQQNMGIITNENSGLI